MSRPITSGSRQAPDTYDEFLESNKMYRKHTARDSSCLFRVVAEQMFDTQALHYEIRLECIRFMTRRRNAFAKAINGDFDAYLVEMAKPRTYGTMLELRALCFMYGRNVVLFEAYNLGTPVIFNSEFKHNFQIFFTQKWHFDSVFTFDYIETAALCQSLIFKLLYKDIFKLPDVDFAVETMLHPQTFNGGNNEVNVDDRGYAVTIAGVDGRKFAMDLPEDTDCILATIKNCNFHSNPDVQRDESLFETFTTSVMNEENRELMYTCPHKFNSCVRQLLHDGITPFPYKVAKSLDPNMYRNIEFDSWNELRKSAKRFNVYMNDFEFQAGAKCHLDLLIGNKMESYICHIQEVEQFDERAVCHVFVEQLGKHIVVPMTALHPVPPDEYRPWNMPLRIQQQIFQRDHMGKFNRPKMNKWRSRGYNYRGYYEDYNVSGSEYNYSVNEQYSQQQLEEDAAGLESRQQNPQYYSHGHGHGNQPERGASSQGAPSLGGGHTPTNHSMVNYMPVSGGAQSWSGATMPVSGEYSYVQQSPMHGEGAMYLPIGGGVYNGGQPMPGSPHHSLPVYGPSQQYVYAGPAQATFAAPHGNLPNNTNIAPVPVDNHAVPYEMTPLPYYYNYNVASQVVIPNQYNSDQTQSHPTAPLQLQIHAHHNDQTTVQLSEETPPATPSEVMPLPTVGVSSSSTTAATTATNSTNTATTSIPAESETQRAQQAHQKRGFGGKKIKRAKRPEQLNHLQQETQHGVPSNSMVSTLTPALTPNSHGNGNAFNFYPASPMAMPMPMPAFCPQPFLQAGQQNAYVWGIAPVALPPSPNNIICGMPHDMYNNGNLEGNAVSTPTLASAPPTVAYPLHR